MISNETAAMRLAGHVFAGKRTGRKWEVLERHELPMQRSPGQFSVGYRVQSEKGDLAFMKATDLGLITDHDANMLDRLQAAIFAHTFERQILDHCNGNNMDRVVVALDYGDTMVTFSGTREPIFFLIFELAESDVRVQADDTKRFDIIWQLGALHHLAVAIQQLHSGSVSHNDIKPANFLIINNNLQKLADLGCATSPLIIAAHDEVQCAGDPRFAPPELLYPSEPSLSKKLSSFDSRRASDLYNLGSMVCFMVIGRMATPEIVLNMLPSHRPPQDDGAGWRGNFLEVLPYWRSAFGKFMTTFEENLPRDQKGGLTSSSRKLIDAVWQLCEPDPRLRGHPENRQGQQDRLDVARYVSLFDLLRKELALGR